MSQLSPCALRNSHYVRHSATRRNGVRDSLTRPSRVAAVGLHPGIYLIVIPIPHQKGIPIRPGARPEHLGRRISLLPLCPLRFRLGGALRIPVFETAMVHTQNTGHSRHRILHCSDPLSLLSHTPPSSLTATIKHHPPTVPKRIPKRWLTSHRHPRHMCFCALEAVLLPSHRLEPA